MCSPRDFPIGGKSLAYLSANDRASRLRIGGRPCVGECCCVCSQSIRGARWRRRVDSECQGVGHIEVLPDVSA